MFLPHGCTVAAADPDANPAPHNIPPTRASHMLVFSLQGRWEQEPDCCVWFVPIMTYCLSKLGTLEAEHAWHLTGQEKQGHTKC